MKTVPNHPIIWGKSILRWTLLAIVIAPFALVGHAILLPICYLVALIMWAVQGNGFYRDESPLIVVDALFEWDKRTIRPFYYTD